MNTIITSRSFHFSFHYSYYVGLVFMLRMMIMLIIRTINSNPCNTDMFTVLTMCQEFSHSLSCMNISPHDYIYTGCSYIKGTYVPANKNNFVYV